MNKETLIVHLPMKVKKLILKNGLIVLTNSSYLNVTEKENTQRGGKENVFEITANKGNFVITTNLIETNQNLIEWTSFTLHVGDILGFEEFKWIWKKWIKTWFTTKRNGLPFLFLLYKLTNKIGKA
jgi:hypothetical protein